MKRSIAVLGVAAILTSLAGCGGSGEPESGSGPVSLSLAGWSLATTPEFTALAEGFHAANPDVTIQLKEYDATNYDTQMIADLAAGKGPDIYVQKNLKNFHTYQQGKQLLDVSDVAAGLAEGVRGASNYQVDGKTYAIPYRGDSWVLYYNKDLFDEAGVDRPDGTWTWPDYVRTSKELTERLKTRKPQVFGDYQHNWQSTTQGFALAQVPGASLLGGDFGYLKRYYDWALDLQNSGAQVSLGDVTTNSLTYQSQFGKQRAAMMPMGTWYIATLLAQQAGGEADRFEWGIAPAPQLDPATTGASATPVTFGDPTALGLNPKLGERETAAAKEFLRYAAGPEGARTLARIGITPADTGTVADTFFDLEGIPTDRLTRFAFTQHDTRPENPVSSSTASMQNILNDLHTAVLSGSSSVDDAIRQAQDRARSEGLVR